ncbi:MAG: drug/metabolite transporter (DMT)-like permease [Rhodothermales bacterium]
MSLLFSVLIWGTNFVVLKAALPAMHTQALNLLRILAAFIALSSLHVWSSRRSKTGVFDALKLDPWRVIATGLLGYTVYQVAFIVGLSNTLAGSAALIMASAPIWTAVGSALLRIERLSAAAWGGLFVSLAGTAWIILSGSKVDLGTDVLFGNLVMLLAAMLWAAYTTLNRPLLAHIPAVALTFYGVFFSILPLTVISWPYLAGVAWAEVSLVIWVAIAFSGAFSTGLTVVLWNDAVRQIGPSRTAVFSYLVPVVALITGITFLGEHLVLGQVVGGTLVISGLLIVRRAGRKKATA